MPDTQLTVTKKEPKSRNRYNWDLLKLEFMQGPFQTIVEFQKFKGIAPSNMGVRNKMTGWVDEKQKMIFKAAKKVAGDLVSSKASEIKKVVNRHASLGKYMQLKGAQALKTLEPKSIEDARKLVQTGIEEERIALGLNEKGGNPSSLTQVNVNVPKTRFDEILDAGGFEELLKLASEVRRERTRRVRESNIVEGEVETQ